MSIPIAEVVIERPSIDIIKILKEDAIIYAKKRNTVKEIMDFYDNTKYYIENYTDNHYCYANHDKEFDMWITKFDIEYKINKKKYIESKNKYDYIIEKLEQLNKDYNLDITEEITNIRETYDDEED